MSLLGERTPREKYEYTAGRIDVRFRHAKYDWIQVKIRAVGWSQTVKYLDDDFRVVGADHSQGRRQGISVRFAAVFCPFVPMIRWLEAVTTQVGICALDWDAEARLPLLEVRTLVQAGPSALPAAGLARFLDGAP